MAWVMSVLGALLAVGGAVSLWNGSGYIRMDWGQAETVAGTVALSAGVLVLGLAAVLFKMRDLAQGPARPPVPASALALDAPAPPTPERLGGRPAAIGLPSPGRVEPVAAVPAAADYEEVYAEPAREPDPAPAAARLDAPASHEGRLRAIPEAPRPAAAPVMAEAPTVVGRYEANGASYVLFSDGTIEVETEHGTHRFESMAHLKDHIERQDAG